MNFSDSTVSAVRRLFANTECNRKRKSCLQLFNSFHCSGFFVNPRRLTTFQLPVLVLFLRLALEKSFFNI